MCRHTRRLLSYMGTLTYVSMHTVHIGYINKTVLAKLTDHYGKHVPTHNAALATHSTIVMTTAMLLVMGPHHAYDVSICNCHVRWKLLPTDHLVDVGDYNTGNSSERGSWVGGEGRKKRKHVVRVDL